MHAFNCMHAKALMADTLYPGPNHTCMDVCRMASPICSPTQSAGMQEARGTNARTPTPTPCAGNQSLTPSVLGFQTNVIFVIKLSSQT